MLHDWGVIAAAFGYISFLFLVASYGDRLSPAQRGRAGALIYPLSLAIYCTSWTFFGSVGFATRTSIDFLAIYVGPILLVGLWAARVAPGDPACEERRTSPRSPTSSARATASARRWRPLWR